MRQPTPTRRPWRWVLTLPGPAGSPAATLEHPMVDVARGWYAPEMNSSFQRLSLLCLILTIALVGLATSGCQTSKGFGKDVEKLGDKIQEKAD